MPMRGQGAIALRLNKHDFRENTSLDAIKQEAKRLTVKEGTSFCVYVPVVVYRPRITETVRFANLQPQIIEVAVGPSRNTSERWLEDGDDPSLVLTGTNGAAGSSFETRAING